MEFSKTGPINRPGTAPRRYELPCVLNDPCTSQQGCEGAMGKNTLREIGRSIIKINHQDLS